MTISTFGSNQECPRVYHYVRLGFELSNGQTKQLTLYTVPSVCGALTYQTLALCQDRFDHLMDLDLADYSSGQSKLEVDIQISIGTWQQERFAVVRLDQLRSTRFSDWSYRAPLCLWNRLNLILLRSLLMCYMLTTPLKNQSTWMIA